MHFSPYLFDIGRPAHLELKSLEGTLSALKQTEATAAEDTIRRHNVFLYLSSFEIGFLQLLCFVADRWLEQIPCLSCHSVASLDTIESLSARRSGGN